jgi:glycosyltransferase involved in cell wall biosynthesis
MPDPEPLAGVVAVMPALDEEGSIAAVIAGLHAGGVERVIVADNGSRDRTAEVARAAGATVVAAPRRGYGSACLAALAALPADATAVLFCDADGADDLARLHSLTAPVLAGSHDLVIGSRVLGRAEPGALTPPQRAGNLVAAALMRLLYRVRVTDLGPFRCIAVPALARLGMSDPAFGWTAEMQVKAFRLGLRVLEVPVDARTRRAGTSKISGRVLPVLWAGQAIICTILRHWYRAPSHCGSVRDTESGVESCNPCASGPPIEK